MLDEIKKDASDRMSKSVASLKQEFTKIRTGRAHTSLPDADDHAMGKGHGGTDREGDHEV